MSQLTDPVFQSYVASVLVLSLNVLGLDESDGGGR
jgi:hypothetical protein